MKTGRGRKKDSEKNYKVNLINNTKTSPQITANEDGIVDSGSTIHCYHRDTPTDKKFPAAVLHAVQSDGYQIVSTL